MNETTSLFLLILTASILRRISLLFSSSDDVVHLWSVRFRRCHGNFHSHTLLDGVFEGKRGYPTLIHGIISLFPQRIWKPTGLFLNMVWDLLVIVLVWCFLTWLGGPEIGGVSLATCAGLLIATCPLLIPVNPRMRSLGARTFGGFLCFVYFAGMGYGLLVNPWIGGIVCVVFGLLIVASSQFAIQVMVLLSLALSLLYLHWFPVTILAVVGTFAWCVPILGLRDILRFRKAHMAWYFRNQGVAGTAPSYRNRFRDHLRFPLDLVFHPNKALLLIFFHSSILNLLVTLPMLIAGGILWLQQGASAELLQDPIRQYAVMVVLSSLIAFFLTSLPWLLFLGEAERYCEYSVPYLAFLFAYLASTSFHAGVWLWGMLTAQLCLCLLQFAISRRSAQRAGRHGITLIQRDDLKTFIAQAEPHRILTLPIKDSFELSSWSDGRHRFFYRCIVRPDDKKGFGYMDEDLAMLDYPRTDLQYFRETYGVDWVVFDKAQLANATVEGLDYSLDRWATVWENDGFMIKSLLPQDDDLERGSGHAS